MVVERYRQGADPVYARLHEGRQLAPGLRYLDSWVVDEPELSRCFQLMDADSLEALEQWIARWSDLVEFEVFPLITSGEAARRAAQGPSGPP